MKFRLLLLLCLPVCMLVAQEKSKVKFGKIAASDFATNVYTLDSSASAVVIADIGSSAFVGNDDGGFSIEFKKFRRAHILNKNGYDIANVEIDIYADGDAEEELQSLRAVTYNLENGKVVETKLDIKTGVFRDKISKKLVVKKFTLPNIKAGSIIEYEYKLRSDFIFNLQPWIFQGEYPCLWSEYTVGLPQFYNYVTLTQGYLPFIKDQKEKRGSFTVLQKRETGGLLSGEKESFSIDATVYDTRWLVKDAPALKEESYTSTLKNHLSKVEFQLSEYREPFVPRNVMGTWKDACADLLGREDFGLALNADNGWLNSEVDDITRGAATPLERAQKLFAYVRDNITCTQYNYRWTEQSLKSLFKNRNGNNAELNILLIAMLRKAGIMADPVFLSTRNHGFAYRDYPLIDKFNHVIATANIGSKTYYLDASEPRLGFGKLGAKCYNGAARVINTEATPVELIADSITESSLTSVFVINDDKGNLSGSVKQTPGYYESLKQRNEIREKGEAQVFANIRKGFTGDVEIFETGIDSLNQYDEPINISYKFNLKADDADIFYFNPMLTEAWKENPFKSTQRLYPVEMPYAIDEIYLLRLDVPKGYAVDELPKQLMVKLNEQEDGVFEYRLTETNGVISLRSRLRIKRTFFHPDEYVMLREFFNLVVKKHGEQIVFKKKS